MKVLPDLYPTDFEAPAANTFTLPHGLIGFSRYTRAELLYLPDHLPFLWMKLQSPTDSVHFIVIEPGGIVPGYEPEIFDDDAFTLDIKNPAEAMVLNIVTMQQQNPIDATANLVGPIIVNRRLRVGRQVVISNYSRYSAHYRLVERPCSPDAQACSA